MDRRKTSMTPSQRDIARSQLRKLRMREIEIQNALHEDKPVVDGKIDFSSYEALLADLREVHAQMTSITL